MKTHTLEAGQFSEFIPFTGYKNSVVYSYGRAVNAVLLEETEGVLGILDYFSIVTFFTILCA